MQWYVARSIVAVNRQGRITLPADVRRRLGIREGTQLAVKVESGTVQLRRVSLILHEDRWAYTSSAAASRRRAIADVRAGRAYELSQHDLEVGNYPKRRRHVVGAR